MLLKTRKNLKNTEYYDIFGKKYQFSIETFIIIVTDLSKHKFDTKIFILTEYFMN